MKSLLFFLLLSGTVFAAPPNVVLILSDDQSWNDYSFLGHSSIETPHLDKLAAESLTYTRGYVTSPLCRPSLASIFNGQHTPHHGITGNDLSTAGRQLNGQHSRVSPAMAPQHEKIYAAYEKQPGLARLLSDAGYLSLQTGKWWEGKPQRHGFTHAMTHADPARGGRHGDVGLKISRDGIAPIQKFLDEAKTAEKPFFLWHAPFLPHTPHNPPEALYQKYLKREPNKFIARYYAMVEWFDQTCGELLDELDQRGLRENTIILYVTDNGWIQSPDNGRFSPRSKQSPYDTGIRTPIMVRFPGKIDPLMDHSTLVSSIDLAPTILKVCGVKVPPSMTGLDLRDTAALKKRNTIYGYDGHHDMISASDRTGNLESRYIVQGNSKLILYADDSPTELYHILKDPFEKKNLAEKQPKKVTELTQALNLWWAPVKK